MHRGQVRRFFFGANSVLGFVPHHEHLRGQQIRRLFILKGGPGVGKSTFIRGLASDMIRRGFNVEYYHCSSDPESLDGCLWPDIKVAVVDGTAPHVVDPRYPGAVDEIINLGEYWDRTVLMRNRQEIIRSVTRISDTFRRAYAHIRVGGQALDMLIDVYRRCAEASALEKITDSALCQFATGKGVPHRILAASAVSPDGPVSFIDQMIKDADHCVLLSGPIGSAAPVMARLKETVDNAGSGCEQFVCGLDPSRIDHLFNGQFGVFTVTPPHYPETSDADNVLEATAWLNKTRVEQYEADIAAAETVHWSAMGQATALLSEARRLHRELEGVYISAMDFGLIDRLRQRIRRQVLRLVRGNDI